MRRRMNQNQNLNESGGIMEKSKTRTIQALLLAFILGAFAFWMGPAVAAEKKMVKDPSTGKMVTAPEYGGTLTYALTVEPETPDTADRGSAPLAASGVVEKLGIGDWAVDRDVFNFRTTYIPAEILRGQLAESWEIPDPLTYIFRVCPT